MQRDRDAIEDFYRWAADTMQAALRAMAITVGVLAGVLVVLSCFAPIARRSNRAAAERPVDFHAFATEHHDSLMEAIVENGAP